MTLFDAIAIDWAAHPPQTWMLVACAVLLGGMLRGLTGFGSALAMVPLMSLVLSPRETLCVATVINAMALAQVARPGIARDADRALLRPMLLGATLGLPLGLGLLQLVPTRFFGPLIGLCVTVLAVVMMLSRSLHIDASPRRSVAAGLLSGAMTGFAGIGGPPAVLYTLGVAGPQGDPDRARATFVLFFAVFYPVAVLVLIASGLPTWQDWLSAALLAPLFLLGNLAGNGLYRLALRTHFRRLALLLMVATGLLAMWPQREAVAQLWCSMAASCSPAAGLSGQVNQALRQ